MDALEGILDVSCKELEQIARNGKYRSREDVELAYKLIDIVKDVYEVWEKEDQGSSSFGYGDGYSRRGYGSYDGGMGYASYAQGRMRGSSRNGGRSYGNYSRHGEEDFADGLRDLMHQAPDEQTRQSIQRMLSQLEQG